VKVSSTSLYYAGLGAVIKKKLWQASSRTLRISQTDLHWEKLFEKLHKVIELEKTPKM